MQKRNSFAYLSNQYDDRARYGNRDLGLFSEAFTLSVNCIRRRLAEHLFSLCGSPRFGPRTASIVGGHWIKEDHNSYCM